MNMRIDDLEFETMITGETIQKRVTELGKQLSAKFKTGIPLFVGILNGSVIFMADLLKEITIPCEIAFMKLSSYHGGLQSTRDVKIDLDLLFEIEGRDVVLIEDIVDTGNTLKFLVEKFKIAKPASITVCTLLYKPQAMEHVIPELEYIGFEIENKFVVGYGLDYKQLGRNTKDIYQLVK